MTPCRSDSKAVRRKEQALEKAIKKQQEREKLLTNLGLVEKTPRQLLIPDIKKIPRHIVINAYKDEKFSWSHSAADREDSWSWGEDRNWTADEDKNNITGYLHRLEGNTWCEVENMNFSGSKNHQKKRHTYQDIDTLPTEAYERWRSIDPFFEYETSFKCHVMNKMRIWGIREQYYFYVIWFERYHMICPSR